MEKFPFLSFFHILYEYYFFNMENIILQLVTEFFTKLGINTTTITVDQVWEDINIRVETVDSALLIGMHGKNIDAFQHLLSRMIERKTNSLIHVHLEVNDYMKQKDEKLFRFLDSKIAIASSTGQSIRMPSLTPYERKKAHSYIADKKIIGLKTQSEWEWIDRALVISYTGELIKKSSPTWSHITPSKTSTHTEISISDEGIGI